MHVPGPASDGRRLLLREEVGRFRQRESRRVFDAAVYVGVLGGPRAGFVLRARDAPAMDAALRIDVVAALLEDSPPDWCTAWLVRPRDPRAARRRRPLAGRRHHRLRDARATARRLLRADPLGMARRPHR